MERFFLRTNNPETKENRAVQLPVDKLTGGIGSVQLPKKLY